MNRDKHFTREDLQQVGKDLCKTILAYTGLKVPDGLELPFDQFGSENINEIKSLIHTSISKEFKDNKDLIEEGNGDSSWGSDDEPSEGNLSKIVL